MNYRIEINANLHLGGTSTITVKMPSKGTLTKDRSTGATIDTLVADISSLCESIKELDK